MRVFPLFAGQAYEVLGKVFKKQGDTKNERHPDRGIKAQTVGETETLLP